MKLIKEVSQLTKNKLHQFIIQKKIDSIAFATHSIPRKRQFLPTIQKELNLNIPIIKIIKIKEDIVM